MLEWITNNIAALTLLVSACLAIISLIAVLINKKLLRLSSQPTLKLDVEDLSIHPNISSEISDKEFPVILQGKRYWFSIKLKLSNISPFPAQNILLDAIVYFKSRKPLGNNYLPIHRPFSKPFLPGPPEEASIDVILSFDNFVVPEIITDFFEGRKQFKGFPVMPTRKEMRSIRFWPSPKIVIKCFYNDIQGKYYCSQVGLFFHIWKDDKKKILSLYVLNIQEIGYQRLTRTSSFYRRKHEKKIRHLRYISFWGNEFKKNELVVLFKDKNATMSSRRKASCHLKHNLKDK